MATVIAEHDVTVLLGDVREQLATLPDASVNCVVTSPPYYGLRDYGVDGQLGLEASPAEYVEAMRSVFAEVRPDGTCWLNLGDTYSTRVAARSSSHQDGLNGAEYGKDWKRDKARGLTRMPTFLPEKNLMGIPWRVAFALQDDGWILRNEIAWSKPNGMPESVQDRFATRHEHVFLLTRAPRYWFDLQAVKVPSADPHAGSSKQASASRAAQLGSMSTARRAGGNPGSTLDAVHIERNPGDVWTIPTVPFPGAHFACMPPALAKRCILAGCPDGGVVLDPFAGSGTTLMVARQLGRRSVGIELNPAYVDIIRDRIGPAPLDFGASA